jgi:hypothetical protein
MTDSDKTQEDNKEPKKVSLAEAVRNQLAQKKQNQQNDNASKDKKSGNWTAKSQMTKKVNNQRRRTGGS